MPNNLQSDHTVLHINQQCVRVPVAPNPYQHLVLSVLWILAILIGGLRWWLSSKESACNSGDIGSIPGLGRSPWEGNGNPLQYSCLENFMDRGSWWVTVHGFTKSWTGLSDYHFQFSLFFTIRVTRESPPLSHITSSSGILLYTLVF